MNVWNHQKLLECSGRHIASVKGMRVQVLDVEESRPNLWRIPFGSLLIVALSGRCDLYTDEGKVELLVGDQALLVEGEQFKLQRSLPNEPAVVQMIWTPGVTGDGS